MTKRYIAALLFISLSFSAIAKEGMWIPSLLKKYNIEEMQEMGFKLTAEDVYSVNNNSMKDAVVLFGRGCTGEMVSDQGLLFTNHHCGYGQIQQHSSVQHDYLTNGFWAKNRSEELANPGLEVRFLDRMDDVSARVFKGTESLTVEEKEVKIKENIKAIENELSDGEFTEAVVKPLFMGNQYFVYVYTIFKDVRLVGAPPSAMGKFGGDTDNWMWPRHTGDFSIFRVYANKDNQPAEYSEDNVPYQPKSHFPISLDGYNAEDFVMVFGFPGTTQEYLPSYAVDLTMNQTDPDRVSLRDDKLSILRKQMEADPAVRIKYAAKYASASNGWKKWQGEIKGLERLDAIRVKQDFEQDFKQWLNANPEASAKYADVLPQLDKYYTKLKPEAKAYYYYLETLYYGTDILGLARDLRTKLVGYDKKTASEQASIKASLQSMIDAYFKDYDRATDEAVFVTLMRRLQDDISNDYLNDSFLSTMEKYTDDKLLDKVYRKSILSNQPAMQKWLDGLDAKSSNLFEDDPMGQFYQAINAGFSDVNASYRNINIEITDLQKEYMAGIMEMKEGKALYPDANMLTMRVAYGKVEGYTPRDGVKYNYQTTLQGIVEKDNPAIYDYDVPDRLKELYQEKDYGAYAEDGKLPVAFIASIHTTGGNSGSPAINANGQLIGINFDRCWEGTMSDIMFDPDHCRNIMVDIRYVLFTIDKFAGAGYLLDEMDLQSTKN